MKNANLIIACIAITTLAMSGCKKDSDGPNDCGGDLTAAPRFGSDLVQYKIDGGSLLACDIPFFASSSNSFITGYAITVAEYGVCEAHFRISVLNSSTPPAYFASLRPGRLPYTRKIYPNGAPPAIVMIDLVIDGDNYTSHEMENTGSTFEILSRSEIFTKNGKSVVTVQGIFCCEVSPLFSSTTAGPKELHGNFSAEFEVE